jgi:hypothetical protein
MTHAHLFGREYPVFSRTRGWSHPPPAGSSTQGKTHILESRRPA